LAQNFNAVNMQLALKVLLEENAIVVPLYSFDYDFAFCDKLLFCRLLGKGMPRSGFWHFVVWTDRGK